MQTFKLLSNDTVLLSQPVLIKQFGRAGAHFLSQLHYWLNKNDLPSCHHQGQRWIYNTAEQWAEQLQLSARHVRRLISEFVDLGVIRVAKLNKIKSVRTNYYSIDYDQLNSSIETHAYKTSSDKKSLSLGQKVPITIQKLTNKDFNKSEQVQNFDEVGEGSNTLDQALQVKQVHDLNLKNEKKKYTDLLQTSQRPKLVSKPIGITTSLEKTSTTQDMLKVWNEVFPEKAKTKLTKGLAPLLVAAFKHKFANNLANWQTYCEQIKSSTYIMRDSFNLTLIWALKFGTIERIRTGELGVKKGEGTAIQVLTYSEQQIEQMVENLQESPPAKAIRHKIIKAVGHNTYYSWFHLAKFSEEKEEIQLIAPNAFVAQYWETNFDWVIKNNKN